MRRGVLPALLLLLVPAVLAAPYRTPLHTDDDEIFEMKGFYSTDITNTTVHILVKYNVTLIDGRFNTSTIDPFTLYLANASGPVAEKELSPMTLHEGAFTSRFVELTANVPPSSVTAFGFKGNHTGTFFSGSTTEQPVSTRVPLTITLKEQTLRNFSVNTTAARRGGMIHVRGLTEHVDSVTISGTTLGTDLEGWFDGWVPLPADIGTGEQTVSLKIVTNTGQVFERNATLTVRNSPPTMTPQYPRRVVKGQDITVVVDARDDTGIASITAHHWNRTTAAPSGRLTLPTDDLSPGNYTITVNVTDVDGATTTDTFTVEVTPPADDHAGNGTTQEDPTSPENVAKNPGGFVQQFVDFISGFFGFLIP